MGLCVYHVAVKGKTPTLLDFFLFHNFSYSLTQKRSHSILVFRKTNNMDNNKRKRGGRPPKNPSGKTVAPPPKRSKLVKEQIDKHKDLLHKLEA